MGAGRGAGPQNPTGGARRGLGRPSTGAGIPVPPGAAVWPPVSAPSPPTGGRAGRRDDDGLGLACSGPTRSGDSAERDSGGANYLRLAACVLHQASSVALDQPATEMGDRLFFPCEATPSCQARAESLLNPRTGKTILFDDGPVDLKLMLEELLEGQHGHGGIGIKPADRRSYTSRPSRR